MGLRAEHLGKSERHPVMGWIEVEVTNITSGESQQTSIRDASTRETLIL
jgi:hypothetical protein